MTPEEMVARLLYRDGLMRVIDKPAGMAVHRGPKGGESLEDHFDALRFGLPRAPALAHRLDRDTSGCLLLARNPKARARFQQAFEAGTVEKNYLAVVDGVPDGDEGLIDLALAKVSTAAEGWRMVPDEAGKSARTRWRKLAVRDGDSLMEFKPLTGRTHQIRVHAARGLGTPIVGDPAYGARSGSLMLLHAWRLVVPRGPKPPIDVTAPVPDSFGLWLDFLDAA
jgi:tRNA pseudouridine32 synthase / 23S rRNA pseudouridine746 synthase